MKKEKMIKIFKEIDFDILRNLNEIVDKYVGILEKNNYGMDKELVELKEIKSILSDNINNSEATPLKIIIGKED